MPLHPLARAIAVTLLAVPAAAAAEGVGTPADSARATVPVRLAPDTTRRRPRAVEYSDWYARRLTIRRTRRYLHAATMLAADAGFVYTGTIAERATRSLDGRRDHRNVALASMGISGAGTLMMWLWKH